MSGGLTDLALMAGGWGRLAGMVLLALVLMGTLGVGARMASTQLAGTRAVRARVRMLRPADAGAPPPSLLRRIGDALARTPLVGQSEVQLLKQNLYAAGMTTDGAVDRFIGFKILFSLLLILLALLWAQRIGDAAGIVGQALVVLGAALVGLRGPDFVIGRRAAARRQRIDAGLPDALDLMVVCAEAGIGIEPALERVSIELRAVHPDLAAELSITVSEMRLLTDRLQGLHNMGARVRLESVKTIASTLSQTLRYGTPLGRALRSLAGDFRLIRQTRMEEAAARLPVLITIPMIVFILPATTLVVAGPAFLQLITALSKM